MKRKGTNMNQEKICGESMSDDKMISQAEENDKKQRNRIDRSTHKYSEEAFMKLPRAEQLALAEKYFHTLIWQSFVNDLAFVKVWLMIGQTRCHRRKTLSTLITEKEARLSRKRLP